MGSVTQKLFNKFWFGAVLGAFEDKVFEIGGNPVALTRKLMADLLRCDPGTIENYLEQRTVAGSDRLALFFANFPAPVAEYAIQHLNDLRPMDDRCGARALIAAEAQVIDRAAGLNSTVAAAAGDGRIDPAESEEIRRNAAGVIAAVDEVQEIAQRSSEQDRRHVVRMVS